MQPQTEGVEVHLLHKHVLKIVCFYMVDRDDPGNTSLASSVMYAII